MLKLTDTQRELIDTVRRVVQFIFPAARIGACTLIGIAMGEISRKQATAGVGHAECAVDKYL